MGKVVASLADYFIITSDNPRTEDPEAIIKDILEGVRTMAAPYVVIPRQA
jgi:UDP-N-acetylmuramoyl-L-alanyl-D-glutamate--2,6-diaminopimelate ligase